MMTSLIANVPLEKCGFPFLESIVFGGRRRVRNGLRSDCGQPRLFFHFLVPIVVLLSLRHTVEASPEVMLGLNSSGHNGHVTRLLIDRHRSQLISVSHDKTIRFWDLATYSPIRTLRPPIGRGWVGEIYSASLSPDGMWLAVSGFTAPEGTNDHSILLISLPDGQLVRRLRGNTLPVQDIAFSPDGRWLAAAGTDGILRIWETSSWSLAKILPGHTARIDSLAWHPDSSRLVTGSWDTTCRFWTINDGRSIPVVTHGGRRVYCVAWSPDGQTVATGGGDRWVKLWDQYGGLRANLVSAPHTLETIAFSPDGTKLLYGYGGEQTNPLAGGLVRLPSGGVTAQYFGHLDTVISSTFSPDGRYAIFGDCDDQICVWEADTGRLAKRLRSEGLPIYATGFGSDGNTIACGYSHIPGSSVKATNPLHRTFSLDRLQFGPLPDYTFMRAQSTWGNLAIERKSFQNVVVSQFGNIRGIYYDPTLTIRSRTLLSGNRAAIGCDQNVIVFDTLTGHPIYRLPGHLDAVWAVTPSPDQRHLLTGSDDETLQIWNLERYEHTLSLYFAGDDWVAWTPQGYFAASPGGENLVGWHVQNSFDEMATFHPVSRFRSRFYRPEVIRRVLAFGGPMQALKELDRINGVENKLIDIKHSLPPKATLTITPSTGENAAGGLFEVDARAVPVDGDSIKSLRLIIDGRPGPENHDAEELAPPPVPEALGVGSVTQVKWKLTLPPGAHQVALKAESGRSIGLSELVPVVVEPQQAAPPRLFVMSIGVSANQRAELNRPFSSADAQGIAGAFTKPPSKDFGDVQVRITTDLQVSRFNFDEGFQWLQQNMTANDIGIVYYSGQALRDSNDAIYFQHQESRPGDPAAGMSDYTLRNWLQKTPGKLLLILDVITRDESPITTSLPVPSNPSNQLPTERRSIEDLIRQLASEDFGVAVLANVNTREVASNLAVSGRSPFAQSIIDGLSGKANSGGGGTVNTKQLADYVRVEMKQRTNGDQRPIVALPALVPLVPVNRRP